MLGHDFESIADTSIRPGLDIYRPSTSSTPWNIQGVYGVHGTYGQKEFHA